MKTAIVRARSVALELYDDRAGHRAYRLQLMKDEGHRRARATEAACHLAAMAYEEGARLATEKLLRPTLGSIACSRAADRLEPTYTEIRNFLIGELDAHEVIACRVAADRIARFNRFRYTDDERYSVGGERGWL